MKFKKHLITAVFYLLSIVVLDLVLAQAAKRTLPKWRGEFEKAQASILTPPYHHGRKPYADFEYRFGKLASTYFTNSLGFRDASSRDVPLKTDKHRILFIGDSITDGVGFAYEKTFVGLIGKALEKNGVEVLNAAVERYAHQIYYTKVRHFIETVKLQVSEVVVVVDVGDMANDVGEHRIDEKGHVVTRERLKYGRTKRFKFWLKDNSILYRLYRSYRDRNPEAQRHEDQKPLDVAIRAPGVSWTLGGKEYDEYAVQGMRIADRVMTKLSDFLSSRNIPLTIVAFPWPIQIAKKDLESKHVKFWRDWAAKNGARFMNFFPYYINDRSPEEVYNEFFVPYDSHFSERGHRFFASKFLSHYLKKEPPNR